MLKVLQESKGEVFSSFSHYMFMIVRVVCMRGIGRRRKIKEWVRQTYVSYAKIGVVNKVDGSKHQVWKRKCSSATAIYCGPGWYNRRHCRKQLFRWPVSVDKQGKEVQVHLEARVADIQ